MKRITAVLLLLFGFILFATNAHAQSNPPVVHAVLFYSPTCAWCLTSAILMTMLLILSTPPAKLSLKNLK